MLSIEHGIMTSTLYIPLGTILAALCAIRAARRGGGWITGSATFNAPPSPPQRPDLPAADAHAGASRRRIATSGVVMLDGFRNGERMNTGPAVGKSVSASRLPELARRPNIPNLPLPAGWS